jgi:2-iminobutanoate/2-iminopropanoate deaminase
MSDRRSIVVDGLGHGANPIPAASRIGPFVATGGIRGVDPVTGQMPADIETQVSLMFANLQAILSAGGADLGDVLKMTFWLATPDARAPINAEWVRAFPDPDRRPARHVLNYALGHGMLVQCDALAVIS